MNQRVLPRYVVANPLEHVINFSLVSKGYSSEEWVKSSKESGYDFSDNAIQVFSLPDYDNYHRLPPGIEYEMALVLGSIIPIDELRITVNMCEVIQAMYGEVSVKSLRGEHSLLTAHKHKELGLPQGLVSNIVVPHKKIICSDGLARVIGSGHEKDVVSVRGYDFHPSRGWERTSAFLVYTGKKVLN